MKRKGTPRAEWVGKPKPIITLEDGSINPDYRRWYNANRVSIAKRKRYFKKHLENLNI